MQYEGNRWLIDWFILVAPVEEAPVVASEESAVAANEEESIPVKAKIFPVDVENDSLEQVFVCFKDKNLNTSPYKILEITKLQ